MKGMKTHKKARHLKWTHPLCPSAGRDTETSAFRVLSVQGQLPCPQFAFRGMASYLYVCFLIHGQAEIVLQAVGRITWEQRRKTSPEASVQTASQRQVMVDNISLILTLQRLLALWLLYYSIGTRGMPRTHCVVHSKRCLAWNQLTLGLLPLLKLSSCWRTVRMPQCVCTELLHWSRHPTANCQNLKAPKY